MAALACTSVCGDKIVLKCCDRRVEVAGFECRFSPAGAGRAVADPEERKTHIAQSAAIRCRSRGEPDQRIVAMPARQFGEAETVAGPGHRDANCGEHVAGPNGRFKQAFEEIVCRNAALTGSPGHFDLGSERQETGGQFRRRIGQRDRPADGTAIANRRMRDVRDSPRQQRGELRDGGTPLGLRMAHQRADFEMPIAPGYLAKLAQAVDIDQERRRRKPHVEGRHKTLASGQNPRIRGAIEQRDRVIERTRFRIGEWRRFHLGRLPNSIFRL